MCVREREHEERESAREERERERKREKGERARDLSCFQVDIIIFFWSFL